MTAKERLIKYLTDKGMWPEGAEKVLEAAKSKLEEAGITWNSQASGYPPALYSALELILDKIALAWIEKNEPQAWYKEMFVKS